MLCYLGLELFLDGLICIGDFGYVDVDGFVYVMGCCKNVFIIVFGCNVLFEWVESELFFYLDLV